MCLIIFFSIKTILSDTLDVYVIELPKIQRIWHNECEKWLSWLNDREDAVKRGITMQNQYIANAEAIYNTVANDPAMQMAFVSMLKAEDREKARVYEAKMKGIEEGIAKAHFETAKVLKSSGTSYEVITKATGLTKEQIDAL
jgi:predicted transposase/invertase (TIGR01784 family)